MAFGLNRVELIGRLGADVTVNHPHQRRARREHLGGHRRVAYINKSRVS